jgi:chemotaxis protein methyltransferase CheR
MKESATTAGPQQIEAVLFLEAVHRTYGYDFRAYADPTLHRRLNQFRVRLGCSSFSEMQQKVLQDGSVLHRLISALTVPVSEMFRDPSFFRLLRQNVLPHLHTYPFLRVWVAGCSTGEELYSLAILFREQGLEDRTMFYATDINPAALQQAEAGMYPLERMALFTQNYQESGGTGSLSDYYTSLYGSAVFDRRLRAKTLFADHSLATDSAFAEVQLVICRNVLIYFERPLQDRAIGLFRDSLVRKGFLGLGSKETLYFSTHAPAFEEFAPPERIYRKKSEL